MNNPRHRYLVLLAGVSLTTLVLDQITKLLVLDRLTPHYGVPVIGDFLRFTLVYNEGGAFSTRLGPSLLYGVISVVVTALVIGFLYRQAGKNRLLDFCLAAVVGGALGNLVDRLRFGSVIDWIDVEFFDIHIAPGKLLFFEHGGYDLTRWPVFNIADAAVTVGVALILLQLIFKRGYAGHADPDSHS